ncbi:MAG TPA: cyclic nucleotide-binding domain-containing protein [Actinomycetota bacterium]|jgi:CRP-like cAMP-binding protein
MARQGAVIAGAMGSRGTRPRNDAKGSSRAERVELLSRVPLFSGLSKRQLRRLAEVAADARYRPFTTIVREGTPGDTFFAIVDGNASVVRGTRATAKLRPGDFFGEISLIDGGPRTASIVAQSPMLTVRLSRAAFNKMLKLEPKIGVAILQEIAHRIRERERPLTG